MLMIVCSMIYTGFPSTFFFFARPVDFTDFALLIMTLFKSAPWRCPVWYDTSEVPTELTVESEI